MDIPDRTNGSSTDSLGASARSTNMRACSKAALVSGDAKLLVCISAFARPTCSLICSRRWRGAQKKGGPEGPPRRWKIFCRSLRPMPAAATEVTATAEVGAAEAASAEAAATKAGAAEVGPAHRSEADYPLTTEPGAPEVVAAKAGASKVFTVPEALAVEVPEPMAAEPNAIPVTIVVVRIPVVRSVIPVGWAIGARVPGARISRRRSHRPRSRPQARRQ